jgi:hypothetical protein
MGEGLSEEAAHVLFDIEDADLPGAHGDAPGLTPDHTASRPQRRVPRVGSLRERFAQGRQRNGAAPTPPRQPRRSSPSKPARAKKAPKRRGQFVKPLTTFYTLIGMATTSRDAVCGPAIVANAEVCARSIDDLAADNPWLNELLWNLTQTGKWTKVAGAHAPIMFAVGMHHSTGFRNYIDNTGMGEFVAKMLADQAQAVRDALVAEQDRGAGDGED